MARRTGKSFRTLARPAARRTAAETVLVVCEGAKTEPDYLRDLVADLKLTGADVQVCGQECGSDPLSIATYAKETAAIAEALDHVYCVFDRDGHQTRSQALALIKSLDEKEGPSFTAVESVPCFEYWVLIHFTDTSKPYAPSGGRSVCDCCIADLKPYIKDYKKGRAGLYGLLRDNLEVAIKRAKRRKAAALKDGADNPSTDLPALIEKLVDLSSCEDKPRLG